MVVLNFSIVEIFDLDMRFMTNKNQLRIWVSTNLCFRLGVFISVCQWVRMLPPSLSTLTSLEQLLPNCSTWLTDQSYIGKILKLVQQKSLLLLVSALLFTKWIYTCFYLLFICSLFDLFWPHSLFCQKITNHLVFFVHETISPGLFENMRRWLNKKWNKACCWLSWVWLISSERPKLLHFSFKLHLLRPKFNQIRMETQHASISFSRKILSNFENFQCSSEKHAILFLVGALKKEPTTSDYFFFARRFPHLDPAHFSYNLPVKLRFLIVRIVP